MSALRYIKSTARLAAAWFVLALAAGVVSPWVQPQTIVLVCSASGANRFLVQTNDGWSELPSHNVLHCPLCLLAGGAAARAPVDTAGFNLPRQPAAVGGFVPWFHPIHEARAPLPARGPPSHS